MKRFFNDVISIIKNCKAKYRAVAIIISVIFVAGAIFSLHMLYYFYVSIDSSKAVQLAETIEASMRAEQLNVLKSDGNITDEEYTELKILIKNTKNVNEDISNAYLLKEVEGKLIIIVDSEETGQTGLNTGENLYGEEDREIIDKIRLGETFTAPQTTNKWGTWVSVIVPITDVETGEIIAAYGNDYEIGVWNKKALYYTLYVSLGIGIVYALFACIYFYFLQSKKLNNEKDQLSFANEEIVKTKMEIEKNNAEISNVKNRYEILINVSNTGGWEYNIDESLFNFSKEYYAMLGITENSDVKNDNNLFEWLSHMHIDDKEKAYNVFVNYIESGSAELYENYFRMQHSEGHWIWILSRGRRLFDEKGDCTNMIVGTHIDISKLKNDEEQISYLNCHDQLTGLYNRRYYEEILGEQLKKDNLPLAIIMADVNGLKLTNDAFGHLSGDNLLRRVAEIIENECRPQDIVARLGGDEFIVLLPNADSVEAEKVVNKINKSIQDVQIDNITLSVSFGWATKKDDDEEFIEVYKRAEYRMYRHKLSERGSKRGESIKIIFKTLQEKSEREQQHSKRVGTYSKLIGGAMELSHNTLNELETAGLMHDIGKIGIDENILNKPGKLTDTELKAMKRHSEIGYRILSSASEFNAIADYVLYHHERWDGKGYPKGLKEEGIPLMSRIISVADAYDAIVSERSYKKALSVDEAVKEIKNNAGTQFDPYIAKVFVEKVLGKIW